MTNKENRDMLECNYYFSALQILCKCFETYIYKIGTAMQNGNQRRAKVRLAMAKKTNGLEWTTCICSTLLCSVLAISEKAAHESDLLIRMQVWFQDSASLHLSISRQCSSVVYATEMKYHLFCIVYQ